MICSSQKTHQDFLFWWFSFTQVCKLLLTNFIAIVVLPNVVRSSLMAKYFLYIGGVCDVPCNIFCGIILPWILGAIINHLQVFFYIVNWTSLLTHIYVQFVCIMFMWSKSIKETQMYENNFKASIQQIHEGEKSPKS